MPAKNRSRATKRRHNGAKGDSPRGFALTIGLNSVDPAHYQGWDGRLNACEADASDMAAIADQGRFTSIRTLLTRDATRGRVINELQEAALAARSGDLFLLTYSGHGGQLPDIDGDEDDGSDETWCLFDGEFVDDELYACLAKFRKGVRILTFSDSCHSGTVTKAAYYQAAARSKREATSLENFPASNDAPVYRAMPTSVALQTYRAHRAMYDPLLNTNGKSMKESIEASALLISGCQDNQLSLDGTFNGLFTGTLLRVWNGGKFSGDHRAFHQSILSRMPPDQSPNYFWAGPPDSAFEKQIPFTIQ